MNPILTTQKLSVEIAGKTLCQDLDLQIHQTECWAILGMNGVGKTTLLHTLAGLRSPLSGTIKLFDQAIDQMPKREVAKKMGLLLQDYEDTFPGTVLQTVLTGRHPHLSNWQWENSEDINIAKQALAFVSMEDFSVRSILTLSGGERRRVAIATLLCQQPQLFMLDEPTNHLDLRYQHQVLADLTTQIKNDSHAAIMIMHDVNLALRYCDHALLLFDNGDHMQGTCTDVINSDNISRLYDYPMRSLKEKDMEIFLPA